MKPDDQLVTTHYSLDPCIGTISPVMNLRGRQKILQKSRPADIPITDLLSSSCINVHYRYHKVSLLVRTKTRQIPSRINLQWSVVLPSGSTLT